MQSQQTNPHGAESWVGCLLDKVTWDKCQSIIDQDFLTGDDAIKRLLQTIKSNDDIKPQILQVGGYFNVPFDWDTAASKILTHFVLDFSDYQVLEGAT